MSDSEVNVFGIIVFLIILGLVSIILGFDLVGAIYGFFASFPLWLQIFFVIFLILIAIIVVIPDKNEKQKTIEIKGTSSDEKNGQQRKIKSIRKTENRISLEDIDKMEGWKFEEFLKKLFEKMDYSVELTQDSNDYGADLILSKSGERISVQAKRWRENVGRKAVQEVYSSIAHWKTQRGIVVCSSDFTNNAIILAQSCNVELWNRDKLEKMLNKYPIFK